MNKFYHISVYLGLCFILSGCTITWYERGIIDFILLLISIPTVFGISQLTIENAGRNKVLFFAILNLFLGYIFYNYHEFDYHKIILGFGLFNFFLGFLLIVLFFIKRIKNTMLKYVFLSFLFLCFIILIVAIHIPDLMLIVFMLINAVIFSGIASFVRIIAKKNTNILLIVILLIGNILIVLKSSTEEWEYDMAFLSGILLLITFIIRLFRKNKLQSKN